MDHSDLVEIKPHERTCMLNCISVLRTVAQTLQPNDERYAWQLMIWTQGLEDIAERMEQPNVQR